MFFLPATESTGTLLMPGKENSRAYFMQLISQIKMLWKKLGVASNLNDKIVTGMLPYKYKQIKIVICLQVIVQA